MGAERSDILLDPLRRRLAPRAFGALYGAFAPLYDRVSAFFFAGQWTVWQRLALDYEVGGDALELGYGTGELQLELCRRGCTPVGVDASRRMWALASRKLQRAGCDARLLVGRADALPLPAESVDSLLSTFPSGYIWDPATWAEARRVLRPGGRFVVVLGGELLPVDHRSRLLIRFHSLVYGDRGAPGATAPPEFPGFRTRLLTRRDARGVAQVLVAEKVADGGPGR